MNQFKLESEINNDQSPTYSKLPLKKKKGIKKTNSKNSS